MRVAVLVLLLVPSLAAGLTVRTDRPRVLIAAPGAGKGTSLAVFKERCTTDPAYQTRCQAALAAGGGLYPAINQAAGYLVADDAARCTAAYGELQSVAADAPGAPDPHSFISNNGRTMVQLAVVRDWCDAALTEPQRQWLEAKIVAYADWYVQNGAPDVYHDDMNNVWNAVALAGLALKGTAQDAKAAGYLAAADAQWKQKILPALAHEGDWWHEGFVYVQPAVGSLAWYATAWTLATDEDLFEYARTQAGDLFGGYLAFHAYAWRPDDTYVYFGDTTDNKQSIELFSRWLVDLLTLGTGSPLGQALSLEIKARARAGYDYSGADAYLLALLHDASLDGAATPRTTLPTARWLSQGAADVAILRSGWGPDDTFVYIACGDYFGAHQRYESGSFQLFRHAPLTGATGYYDAFDTDHWANYYSQHAVHANVVAVEQPGEFFPTIQSLANAAANVNDGGQRVLRMNRQGTKFPNVDLPSYLANKTGGTRYETGDLTAFQHGACHDYVACDVTAAYTSPGYETNGNGAKVTEVTRQFVFLRPALLLVFDRVEATDASYPKRFLLHALGTPNVSGRAFDWTSGGGRLFGQTLLPAGATIDTITNFSVAGTPHPPSTTGRESGGTRLEVVAPAAGVRDYFLHALYATEATTAAAPAAQVTEDAAGATVSVDEGGRSYTVSFAKTGPAGGHLTVREGATTVCDLDLGMGETPGADGGVAGDGGTAADGGGPPDGARPDGGAAGDGGTGAAELGSGCGCRPSAGPAAPAVALLALALLGRARRRRRPAP